MSVKQYDSQNKILKLIAGGTLWADCPIGTINAYGGATAPEGWILCQGQALSRTDYKDLFDVIGTSYGSGDGSTTFNLPDMREATTKGAGTTSKTVGAHNAINVGDFVDDRTQSHTHTVNVADGFSYTQVGTPLNWGVGGSVTLYANNNTKTTSSQSGRTGNTTEVKAVGVNYIMKAKHATIPADLKAALEAALDEKDMLVWG